MRGKKERRRGIIFKSYERQYGTLNATPRIPQQFAKITAVICRRLCSYCVPVLVYPYTYFHTHVYTQHSIYIRAHEGRCCTQYTRSQALVLLRASMLEAISDPPSSLYPLGPFLFTLLPTLSLPRLLNHFLLCPSYLHVLSPWMHPPVRTFIPIGCICT